MAVNTFELIYRIKGLGIMKQISIYHSWYLNELLQASCLSPFRPAELFKFVPNELVRKNLAANLDRSPLMRSYGYASSGDRPTLFAIFSLSFVPTVQYAG
jgi:hypothetical protein